LRHFVDRRDDDDIQRLELLLAHTMRPLIGAKLQTKAAADIPPH